MEENKRHRVKFYSKEDGATGSQLREAEKLLESHRAKSPFSLNDLIEFYNIQLYFDNQLSLPTWKDSQKLDYNNQVQEMCALLKERIYNISDIQLESEVKTLDFNYHSDFWKLLNDLNGYKDISDQTISNVLHEHPYQTVDILNQKQLVQKFDQPLRDYLIKASNSAEILLASIEEKGDIRPKKQVFFPKSLTLADKEGIIKSYLEGDKPNLNYVRLIEKSRDTNTLRLSPKTRLKAKRKSKELNDEIFQKGNSWKVSIGVSFDKDQLQPVLYKHERTGLEVTYSESFIDKLTNEVDLFLVFKYLFQYTDKTNLIALVSRQSELDVLERTLMKSKNEYETGFNYQRKEHLSDLQLHIFEHYLKRNGKSLELLINSFVDHINKRVSPHTFVFQLPLDAASYIEKVRTVIPDLESLLKQYQCLVDEQCIDFDLIRISSKPLRLGEIYSHKSNKYLYTDDNLLLQLQHLFFSDQSHLFYVKHFENKYRCLYDLITNENVKLEYFENYQRGTIERLIDDGYLKLSNEDYVALNKEILLLLLGDFQRKEVLSYWNYPDSHRKVMDSLIEAKTVVSENTLLSRQERNYFNYYLNKKEFTNGYDLRNKYLHGTNTFSEKEHDFDYHRMLKLIVLLLLKIEDDLTSNK